MKPEDVFGIFVRTIGLMVCLGAVAVLYWAAVNFFLGGPTSPIGLAIVGVPQLGVGLWLLRGAPLLITFAFPSRRDHDRGRDFEGRLA